MQRDENLIPLSHDHQHALDVALRLKRATAADIADVVQRFETWWAQEGDAHFDLEEQHLLPALPSDDEDLQAGCRQVRDEHVALRGIAEELLAGEPDVALANSAGILLNDHVRYEERQFFPLVEERLDEAVLARVGAALRDAHHP